MSEGLTNGYLRGTIAALELELTDLRATVATMAPARRAAECRKRQVHLARRTAIQVRKPRCGPGDDARRYRGRDREVGMSDEPLYCPQCGLEDCKGAPCPGWDACVDPVYCEVCSGKLPCDCEKDRLTTRLAVATDLPVEYVKDFAGAVIDASRTWLEMRKSMVEAGVLVCDWCKEPIEGEPSDQRLLCATMHPECLIRAVIGSLEHQRGVCSCYGGTERDPPELTVRQAAKLAADNFHEHQKRKLS